MRFSRKLAILALVPLLFLTRPVASQAAVSAAVREAAISLGLIGAAFALDDVVQPGFPDHMPGVLVEEPGEIFGGAWFLLGGTAALAVHGVAFDNPASVTTARKLGLAMGATTAAVWVIKFATQRTRPDGSNHYSFPSGHTAVAFAAAAVLERRYGRAVGLVAYTAASMAGEARIADNHHYLSDVVAGAILGRLIGRYVARGESAILDGRGP